MLAVLSTTVVEGFAPAHHVGAMQRSSVQMAVEDTFAPEGMGKEFLVLPRKPLSEYVGASVEFCAYPGAPDTPVPWDPLSLCELYKVSGNNPDVAWMREAELKHGRFAMMAVVGIIVQSSGLHDPYWAPAGTDWVSAPTQTPALAWGSLLTVIGLVEGSNSAGMMDLWNGQTTTREPGNYGWGKSFMPTDPVAADKMRLKELKNGRLAMLAFMGIAMNHFIPGALPGCMYS